MTREAMISGRATHKTVIHSLMMKLAITMITDIRAVSAPDLSVDNEVIDLSRTVLPGGKRLSGVCWSVVGGSAGEALLSVLSFFYGLTLKKLPDYGVWLLVGDSVWQPDTRIVRYHRLWGALAARGLKVSHACNPQELMIVEDGKLKFFGAIKLSELSVKSVAEVLLRERCAYVSVLPGSVEPKGILELGWTGDLAEDFKLLIGLVEDGGLLVKRYGEFGDREKGVVAIGCSKPINLILSWYRKQ